MNEPSTPTSAIQLFRVSFQFPMMLFWLYNINCLTDAWIFTFQAPKFSLEMIMEQATALQELLPIRMQWEPVEKILNLNGVPLILRIIAYSYEWIYSGR